jgi:hypothetical protein
MNAMEFQDYQRFGSNMKNPEPAPSDKPNSGAVSSTQWQRTTPKIQHNSSFRDRVGFGGSFS